MKKQVCANCGSEDIGVDAIVEWDKENQAWKIYDVLSSTNCATCECGTWWKTEEIK